MAAALGTGGRAIRRAGLAAAVLAALGLFGTPEGRAAGCADLEAQIEAKVNALNAEIDSGAVGGMCTALSRDVGLLEEMIAFHEQCGDEMDPTGAQLAEYRSILPETIAARDQLCGG